jgi:uncharacterized RDD family membrane protein YckC
MRGDPQPEARSEAPAQSDPGVAAAKQQPSSESVTPRSAAEAPSAKRLSERLKDQIGLVGLLVVFVGLCSTDSYYGTLSISYQFIALPASHVVYRGITALAAAPWLLLPYLLAVAWLVIDETSERRRIWRAAASYGLVILLLAVTYPMARWAGRSEAQRDLCEQTSRLPRIVSLRTKSGENLGLAAGYRLLLRAGGRIVFFKPLARCGAASDALPNIRDLPESEVQALEMLPHAP